MKTSSFPSIWNKHHKMEMELLAKTNCIVALLKRVKSLKNQLISKDRLIVDLKSDLKDSETKTTAANLLHQELRAKHLLLQSKLRFKKRRADDLFSQNGQLFFFVLLHLSKSSGDSLYFLQGSFSTSNITMPQVGGIETWPLYINDKG